MDEGTVVDGHAAITEQDSPVIGKMAGYFDPGFVLPLGKSEFLGAAEPDGNGVPSFYREMRGKNLDIAREPKSPPTPERCSRT